MLASKLQLYGKLSRTFEEHTGNRQGHVKASGHFKTYINPCLDTLNSTDLGFHIGLLSVLVVCCADDTYLLSGTPSGLQAAIKIVEHYARRYRVVFNASKTKIVKGVPKKVSHSDFRVGQNKYYQYILNFWFDISNSYGNKIPCPT